MIRRHHAALAAVSSAFALLAASPAAATITVGSDPVLYWNQVLSTGLAGSPPAQARGAAMVNIALYDSINATLGSPNHAYLQGVANSGGNTNAAAAVAAHAVLSALNPGNVGTFNTARDAALGAIPDSPAKTAGMATGAAYAQAILSARAMDGANVTVMYQPSGLPGRWAPTPPSGNAALPHWGGVDPFVIASGDQFRPTPPPSLTSATYTAAFNEIKAIGVKVGSTRTQFQTEGATFWAAVSNGWLKAALGVAEGKNLDTIEYARLFALLTTAGADAGISVFDAKYFFDYWRPQTAIRGADGDGNDDTTTIALWESFNVEPAHPSYTSGLSTDSGASAGILAALLGDANPFSLTAGGVTREWSSFSAAALDAANSRVWGGIHWRFDGEAGLLAGQQIAQYALDNRVFDAIPEPATWGMMIAGFGLVGGAMRRRANRVRFAAV